MFKTPDYVSQEDASDNAELTTRLHGRIHEVLISLPARATASLAELLVGCELGCRLRPHAHSEVLRRCTSM